MNPQSLDNTHLLTQLQKTTEQACLRFNHFYSVTFILKYNTFDNKWEYLLLSTSIQLMFDPNHKHFTNMLNKECFQKLPSKQFFLAIIISCSNSKWNPSNTHVVGYLSLDLPPKPSFIGKSDEWIWWLHAQHNFPLLNGWPLSPWSNNLL